MRLSMPLVSRVLALVGESSMFDRTGARVVLCPCRYSTLSRIRVSHPPDVPSVKILGVLVVERHHPNLALVIGVLRL